MQPREIVKLYKVLCPICRYDWVYENKTPVCANCHDERFLATSYRIHTSHLKYYEDYSNNVFHTELVGKTLEKGRALAIFTKELPASHELFETFLTRSDFIFGRFFTKKRFIGTSLPRYELLYTNVFFFTT